MVDQRKALVPHLQWNNIHYTRHPQRHYPPTRAFKVCDAAVVKCPILQRYFNFIHNETYVKNMQFSEFRPRWKFLSIPGEHMYAVSDRCN